MAVIMDMVLNHSFGQSPMVQMYWDGGNNRPAADNPWFNVTLLMLLDLVMISTMNPRRQIFRRPRVAVLDERI
jgi:hypothetical protein